jgi:hypothetical protein
VRRILILFFTLFPCQLHLAGYPCENDFLLIGNSIFHGTVVDTSLLIDHLESFIDVPAIERHLVLGISLGGHACWQLFFSEPRITAVVVIIGCPDYTRKCLGCSSPTHAPNINNQKKTSRCYDRPRSALQT